MTSMKFYLLFAFCFIIGLSTASQLIHSCSEMDIPNVPFSDNDYNGNNSILAKITYKCDFLSRDATGDDKLESLCRDDGTWSSPFNTLKTSMTSCPPQHEACPSTLPIISYASVNQPLANNMRPPVNSYINYTCQISVRVSLKHLCNV